ncbi:MAG: hypothetical protein J6N70_00490 [Oribacterium sp.]|nr:hypothetical protein [Oribacterium sp.]
MENTRYMDISEYMDVSEISDRFREDDESALVPKGLDPELIAKVVPGMVVLVKRPNGNEQMFFVLSKNGTEESICGTAVYPKSSKNSVFTAASSWDYDEHDKNIKRSGLLGIYISTTLVETVKFSDITGFKIEAPVLPTIYLQVLNRVIGNCNYDEVVNRYEEYKSNISYDDIHDIMDKHGIKLHESLDAKTILLNKQKKQLDKALADIEIAKKYKDSSKKELQNLKKDYQSMKDALNRQKNENIELKGKSDETASELASLSEKYHELLEKYAASSADAALQASLDERELELAQAKKEILELKAEKETCEYNFKKSHNENSQTIKDLQSQLLTAETSIRKLSSNIANEQKTVEGLKKEVSKKDKEIDRLKKQATVNNVTSSRESELDQEIERLKSEISTMEHANVQRSCNRSREYLLTPGENDDKEEQIMLPSVIGYRLKKLMEPVPQELRASLLAQMISYFEDSVRDGDITVNMMTKFTLQ